MKKTKQTKVYLDTTPRSSVRVYQSFNNKNQKWLTEVFIDNKIEASDLAGLDKFNISTKTTKDTVSYFKEEEEMCSAFFDYATYLWEKYRQE